MATLSNADIKEIIEKNPNKELVQFGRSQRARARLHLYGVGMDSYLTSIEGFEKPFMHALRLKFAPPNKDMFARVDKPIDKVFTARGGSSYYNLGPEGNQQAADLEASVRNGIPVKKWLEDYWEPHIKDDPMGVIFIEVDRTGRAYPTYKCIDNIYDYHPDGTGFEYIVFDIGNAEKLRMGLVKEDKVWRVVDDRADRIIKFDGQDIVEVPSQTYTNWFYDVPARVIGFVANPDGDGYVSFYDPAFDLADQYLLKQSIKLTSDFMHAFPKYWEFGDDCVDCGGTGLIKGKKHAECKGTGKKLMTRPSDIKILSYPDKETPNIAPQVAGYVEPSKTFWEIATADLGILEQKITTTIWGSKNTQKLEPGKGLKGAPNGQVTATEIMDNRAPECDALHLIANAAEGMDKFIMDHLIMKNLQQTSYIRKGGCSKNYGRRWLIEEPDALLDRYSAAREKGLSPGILYGMYEQYLEAKYQGDGVSLNLHKKLVKVEPFMHLTLEEVKALGDPEEVRRKQWYGEWLASMDGDRLIMSSVKELQTLFTAFCATKPLGMPELDKQHEQAKEMENIKTENMMKVEKVKASAKPKPKAKAA